MSKPVREDHPAWPYPFLFHGHELTRDIFFLDPLIEYKLIELGDNEVRDAGSAEHRSLNGWFHYAFFNGISSIINTAETSTLLPRLVRLQGVLLKNSTNRAVRIYLEQELSVPDAAAMLTSFVGIVAKMVQICRGQVLVVWGVRVDDNAPDEQAGFIADVIVRTPTVVVSNLLHLKDANRWNQMLFSEEESALRAAKLKHGQRGRRRRADGGIYSDGRNDRSTC